MAKFKDASGKEWAVVVTVATLKRVKALLDVDLMEVVDEKSTLLERLADDPVVLCNVLYAVMKPEADRRGVNDEAFGESLFGDALNDATRAFLESLSDFFRSPTTRTALKAVTSKIYEVEARMHDLLAAKIKSGELDKIVNAALESAQATVGESSTTLPGKQA